MKITLIHGQNHKGSTYHIGRMLADKITDAEITEFFLPKDLNHFCLGCYRCIDEESACPFYEEKSRILNAVEKTELLIFTTPTYCMRASAPMKSFIDLTFTYWMVHRPRKCMFSKKAVVISTAAGTGMKSAIKDIANALFYWGVPCVKTYGVSVQAMGWEQVEDKKKQKIEKDMTQMAKAIQKKKVCVGLKTKFMFGVMRMMQKNGMGSGEREKEYWETNGWLSKGRPWK
jgi:multimeric flavodoxin WrbA